MSTTRSGATEPRSASDSSLRCSASCRAESRTLVLLVVLTVVLGVADLAAARLRRRSPRWSCRWCWRSLVLGPRQLPWFVVFVLLDPGRAGARSSRTSPSASPSTVLVVFAPRLHHPARPASAGPGSAWPGCAASRCWSTCATASCGRAASRRCRTTGTSRSELRSAGGTAFAGDFVVTARHGDRLDVVVVDVSGKGEGAGTRALLLSGALGGLLRRAAARGLPRRGQRLPAATRTGTRASPPRSTSRSTSTPGTTRSGRPATRRPPCASPGPGRWSVLEAEGPVLGLIDGATYEPVEGTCGAATRCCSTPTAWSRRRTATSCSASTRCSARPSGCCAASSRAGPKRLIESIGSRNDDRALLLVHRR